MTEEDYIVAVNSVLAGHSDTAVRRIRDVLGAIPEKAKRMTIDLFVDQDGEGCLTVRIGLDGPDRIVLNKAIATHAELFKTRSGPDGFDPPLPMMDPEDEEFSVHDTLTDCAVKWISKIWKEHKLQASIPVVITSPEGYGSLVPKPLK